MLGQHSSQNIKNKLFFRKNNFFSGFFVVVAFWDWGWKVHQTAQVSITEYSQNILKQQDYFYCFNHYLPLISYIVMKY